MKSSKFNHFKIWFLSLEKSLDAESFCKCAFTLKKSIFSEFVFTTGVVATKEQWHFAMPCACVQDLGRVYKRLCKSY